MAKLKAWLQAKVKSSRTSCKSGPGHLSAAYSRANKPYILDKDDVLPETQHVNIVQPIPIPQLQPAIAASVVPASQLRSETEEQQQYAAPLSAARPGWPDETPKKTDHAPVINRPKAVTAEKDVCFPKAAKKAENDTRKAEKLIEKHADSSQNALYWAIQRKQHQSVDILLKYGLPDAHPWRFSQCLQLCLQRRDTALFSRVVTAAERSGYLGRLLGYDHNLQMIAMNLDFDRLVSVLSHLTAVERNHIMHGAVERASPVLVKPLLALGVDPNTCFERHSILPAAICRRHKDIISALTDHPGIDVNALGLIRKRGPPMRPALVEATMLEGTSVLGLLLACPGADINAADENGNTALHSAARLGRINTVRYLLRRGADPVKKNKQKQQPIHVAGEKGHTVCFNEFLESAGLPPVTSANGAKGLDSTRQKSKHGRHEAVQGKSWPDQEVYDRHTTKRVVVKPSNPGYWN